MGSQFWHETENRPPARPRISTILRFLVQTKPRKHSSPSRDKRNETRLEKLTPRQVERIKIMGGAFLDREVAEKVALEDSEILRVERGDVLVGQAGRYLHPRLFRVIKI